LLQGTENVIITSFSVDYSIYMRELQALGLKEKGFKVFYPQELQDEELEEDEMIAKLKEYLSKDTGL
jgi:hypothetical protein